MRNLELVQCRYISYVKVETSIGECALWFDRQMYRYPRAVNSDESESPTYGILQLQ